MLIFEARLAETVCQWWFETYFNIEYECVRNILQFRAQATDSNILAFRNTKIKNNSEINLQTFVKDKRS
jgi:hypothetical protein